MLFSTAQFFFFFFFENKHTQLVQRSEKVSQYELFRFNIVRVSLPNCETILPLSSFVKTTFFFPQQSINIQLLSHAHSFFFDHSPLKVGKTRWWHPPPNSWDSPPLPQRPTGVKTSGASGREIHPQSHQSAVDLHHISSGAVHRRSSSWSSDLSSSAQWPDISLRLVRSSVGSYT